MNKTTYLGELEHMILLAVLRLGEEAYGMAIRDELANEVGREVKRSAAYITLERLSGKGYLTTRMGDSTPERGGRAKRYYQITAAGREALRESGLAFKRLWEGQESLLEET